MQRGISESIKQGWGYTGKSRNSESKKEALAVLAWNTETAVEMEIDREMGEFFAKGE